MTLLCSRHKFIHPIECVSLFVSIGHIQSVQRLLLLWVRGIQPQKAFFYSKTPSPHLSSSKHLLKIVKATQGLHQTGLESSIPSYMLYPYLWNNKWTVFFFHFQMNVLIKTKLTKCSLTKAETLHVKIR